MTYLVYIEFSEQNTLVAVSLAVCEDERRAAWYEARGYGRVEREAFSTYWSLRDELQLAERPAPRSIVETAPLARAVGEPPKPAPVYPSNWHWGR